jgi:SEC-C motif-containing protein
VSIRDAGTLSARCPCLSGDTYAECCGPIHSGAAEAPTAERLMRSRFSAFALGDAAYLLASWHPSTRPSSLELDPGMRWYRLDIVGTTRGGMLDDTGTVHFRAYYKGDAVGVQEEDSRFARVERRWYYVDGDAANS